MTAETAIVPTTTFVAWLMSPGSPAAIVKASVRSLIPGIREVVLERLPLVKSNVSISMAIISTGMFHATTRRFGYVVVPAPIIYPLAIP